MPPLNHLTPQAGPIQPPGRPGWLGAGSRWGGFRGVITHVGKPAAPPVTPVAPPKYGPGRPAQQALAHFQMPFTLDPTGKPICVEQDTPQDVSSSVYNIAACPQGAKIADPAFGIPGPLFQTLPLNTQAITQAITRIEPRAELDVTEVDSTQGIFPLAAINDSTLLASGGNGTASIIIEVSTIGRSSQ